MQSASQTNQDKSIQIFPETVPLSFAQQRLWFLDRLQGPNATYNISLALWLEGHVDRRVLETALADVIRRHESLRTVFPDTADVPCQQILAPQEAEVPLRCSDIDEATLREALAQEAAWCFDLRQEIPLRAALFRLEKNQHVLLLLLHHIAGDGWSMAPLARDLGVAYAARRAGHGPAWEELPVQYADYTLWQRELLGTEDDPDSLLAKQAAYWRQALAGLPELLTLPTDRPRPAVASHRGANHAFKIDAALYGELLALGRNNRATLFMVLQAALSALFTRLGAGTDIPLGSPIAGRTDDTLHDLVGFFANTLVLRTDTSGNPAFQDLLARVRNNNLAAYKHQDLPFDRLVEVLRPARSLAYQPLFQVMLILQNNPEAGFDLPGLSGVPEPVDLSVAKFDMTFSFTESQAAHGPREGMACVLEYATDLYDEASIEALAARFVRLLRAVVAAPSVLIGEIDLLDDAERVQLLDTWNDTAGDYPKTRTIQQLFEAQAEHTPDAVAAMFDGIELTYAALNAKANQLAHYLRSVGVGPDVLVGLCVERSLDMIVGLLGILKAGGAYVPLDPAYPPDRLAHMLADAKPVVLLTQQHLVAHIDSADVPAFCLDTESHALADQPARNPVHTALPANLAYVIYTSGSTGKPKGVAVRHSGLVNFIDTMQGRPGIAADEVLLSVTSLSFDIAALELFLPLVAGARIVLASRETAVDPQLLAALAVRCHATMMQATPSTWRLLADHGWPRCRQPLKVLCGGEALPVDLARQMLQHVPVIWNLYGPTETTIWSTLECITSAEENPSIGRPVGNTRIYILDAHLNPVPAGVAGELHIGGEGLARGYLHRPALTAERFIADPYSDVPGARMYKTGDLARYLPDGRIDYLGRIDNQVKIRGFRIELGEIEAALENCEGVGQAVVVAQEDATGGKRLAAYVVPREEAVAGTVANEVAGTEALRAALAKSLPDYMLPSHVVWLDRLPLTPNGKIDRKALPVPEMDRDDSAYAAPRTPDEQTLAAIWAEVLKLDRAGIHDNFFSLGGHSMLAAQVISRISKAFQVDLPLRVLFEMPTIAALAQRIGLARQEQPAVAAAIAPVTRSGPQPLSFGQMRLWFLDQFEPGSALYNLPVAIRMQGRLDAAVLARCLNDIVGRHEALRTTFVVEHGTPLQVIAPSLELRLPVSDLAGLPPDQCSARVQQCMQDEARQPFDLAAGPLLRACLLRLDADEHVLVLNMHHIVSDGWSIGVLVRELAALYAAHAQGLPSPLSELPVQYADFCHWQRRLLDEAVLQQQMDYWKQQLDGAPALLALPTDRPRPAVQSHRGATVAFTVPAETVKSIARLGEQTQCTLFMVLTAAFNVLLARYSGQSDICIGTAVAHRNRPEIEPLIGLFVNTLVLRLRVELQTRCTDLLQQVRDTALLAYAHQDVPFEQLVEALKPERHTGHTPLFQVMLSLQNTLEANLAAPGLSMQPEFVDSGTAKFDLTLNVMEQAGQLHGVFEYDTALFDASTIERMASHFLRLLGAMAATPGGRVGDLPMLGEHEARQLLVDWNDTAVAYPDTQTVHRLLEAQVARTPHAPALVFGDERLTYAELNARANRLAHHLRDMGVAPDTLAGICVERSPDMIVGLLAILKAGGAYLPLDPVYPQERLAYMLADSKPVVVLTQQHLQARLCGAGGVPVFCIDAEADMLADQPANDLGNTTLPGNLAYVIYTSGSTGKPKGVGITHQAINRLVFDTDYVSLQAGDRVAQVASSSFDAITFEVWSTLLHGGQLCLIPYETIVSPSRFAAEIKRQEIDTLFITAALFTQFAFQAPDAFSGVRDLLVGGDAVDPRAVGITLRSGVPQRLLNAYGPTESTTFALWHLVESVGAGATNIPLGRPIANTQIYLLDSGLNPVPVGVAGELYIAGDGLARGYLGRPALTAERFVANPFGKVPGSRMYKTGDLARYLPNGDIEYLGRIDNQVKIRGFRIEPGEIEAALAALPEVREAVVLVREDIPGDKRLAAYVVTRPEVAAGALRARLAQTLPDYMVPSHFIPLDGLPLTPNGKIDRKALPAPSASRSDDGYVAPRTPAEETLAAIWAEVLKLDRVGIHDNFFALGGHSLLAITLLDRMRSAGLQADVRALFAAPTIAALAAAVNHVEREVEVPPNRIPADCRAITPEMLTLVPLTSEDIARIEDAVPGGAANIQDIYPLAPLQEGILFHHRMSLQGDLYLIPMMFAADSRERLDLFLDALQAVIDRHDILRTAVLWEGLEQPLQVVWRRAPVMVEGIGFDAQAGDIARQLADRHDPRRYRIDVRSAPMLHAFVAHDAANGRWLLQLMLHHLISDHTTLEIMIDEIRAILQGGAARLPAPLPFRDFIARARLGVSQAEHETFFKEMLSAVDQPTAPFGLLEALDQASGIEKARRVVEPALAQRLRLCARRSGVGAASLMHLAWAQVLARLTGRRDVVFGTVLFGRMQGGAGADRVLGMFINTLPLCLHIGEQGVAQSLRDTHALLTRLLRHEHASLALAQRCSGVAAPDPLFSSILNYRHSSAAQADATAPWDGIKFLEAHERTNYPFSLSVDDLGEGFALTAHVSAAVEARRICDYMHTALEHLAEALDTAPDTPAFHMEVLPPSERHRMLAEWNDTAVAYPDMQTVHRVFEAQAARTPDAVALSFEDEQLTYAELNARANRLAHRLRGMGVGPDMLAGICVERSPDMIVGLLAILKAGGAYLPLDPVYPQERLAHMLADAKPTVLLTQQRLRENLPAGGIPVFCLEDAADMRADQPAANLGNTTMPGNLAYVIYTSGSTGKPKGVGITHQAINRLVFDTNYVRLRAGDKVAQAASSSFDAITFEIWSTLLHGGQMCLIPYETIVSPSRFAAQIKQQGIDTLFITTALFNQFAVQAPDAFSGVRDLLFGGEAVDPRAVNTVLRSGAPKRLLHVYGPTESTTFALWHLVQHVGAGATTIPLGRPIANTQIYLLDSYLNPVPVGVAGELCIAGVGLARGYLGRPSLTAERFIANPFSEVSGSRMYKTGDLARYLPNGDIEYLGRIDHQVKIRGFRIELGEIEVALAALPEVRDAIVMAREDVPGDKRLAAYVVARQEAGLDAADLRAQLAQTLPDYMVPSHFILLDGLPLTPNGKIDRKALPAPSASRGDDGYAAPRTSTEQTLGTIWADVLKLDRVGIHDNFFALGGHSLLATQVISKLRNAFQVDLPLKALFDARTIHGLAQCIDAMRDATIADIAPRGIAQPAIVPAEPADLDAFPPLSFAQQRLWFLNQLHPNLPNYYITPYWRPLQGDVDRPALAMALNAVIARHEALRTTFPAREGVPWQSVAPQLVLDLPLTDLSALPPAERESRLHMLMQDEAGTPFDLATGPLVRARLLRTGPQSWLFMLTMHHIVTDGWSLRVLDAELAQLYDAFTRNQPEALPPRAIQYTDFARWQHAWLAGDTLERLRAYWRRQLKDAPALLELPVDKPRRTVQTYAKGVLPFSLDEKLGAQLDALNRAHNVTLFMTLQATLKVLFHCCSGQDDISIGGLVANRHHAELEPLIGFFCNTVVFRSRLQPQQSFADLLAQVRTTTLDAYAHQDLPIELVLDALGVARTLCHSPLFQVLLVLQNAGGERPASAYGALQAKAPQSMHMVPLQPEPGADQREIGTFDLTLNVTQEGDRLNGHWEYNRDLFEHATIESLHWHFTQLLERLSTAPEIRLQELGRFEHATPAPAIEGSNVQGVRHNKSTEDALASIWRSVLGVDSIGAFDNFFKAGGNSLLAVKMLHAVKKQFGVALPLATIFTAQTVAKLASEIETRQASRVLAADEQ